RAFAVFDDGFGSKLFVGGGIDAAGGVPIEGLAKWDGASWADAGISLNSWASSLLVSEDRLYLGGSFTKVGGQSATKLCVWDGADTEPVGNTDLGNGLSATASAFATVDFDRDGGDDPRFFVAGGFLNAGDTFVDLVAELDGESWLPLSDQGPNKFVWQAVGYDDGSGEDLYIAGEFSTVDGVPANVVARWDGANWSDLGGGLTGSSPNVLATQVYDDGAGEKLYFGGYGFDSAGPVPVDGLTAWDGTQWTNPGGGFPGGLVYALAVYGNQLCAGGRFESAGGVAAANIAFWDGAMWTPVGAGFDQLVLSLASLESEGSLFAYGAFTESGGVPLGPIARWDGVQWTDASAGLNGDPLSLQAWDDGSGPALYVSVRRQLPDGRRPSYIMRWNGVSWIDLPAEFDGLIRRLGVGPDPATNGVGDALYVGGEFLGVNGISSAHVARLGCSAVSGWDLDVSEVRDPRVVMVAPNPTNADISFHLAFPTSSAVQLDVFDIAGARASHRVYAPASRIQWDGRDDLGVSLPTGTYLYRLRAGDRVEVGRITVVR
ncbi:MAG: T9SS type A sorting domain-containing protein, partial [Candidatus Eisenbacteria bacterium]|nr:T9SS type A sorting domain-containing protein [Candidatus Eisenbacteria bacterium]